MEIPLFFILSTAALINGQNPPAVNYGQLAAPRQFPFAAAIYHLWKRSCNGAIISEFYIITAAHCITDTEGAYRVQVGKISSKSDFLQVQRIHRHPSYNKISHLNDIGFIQLEQSLVYSSKIRPIAYESVVSSGYSLNCTLIRYKGTDNCRTLWHQTVVITTEAECRRLYPNLNANEQCILTPYDPVQSPPPGDSGSPIMCDGKLTAILVAAISSSIIDMAAKVIMVAPYQQWIGDKIY